MEKLKIYIACSLTLMCAFLFGGLLYTAVSEPVETTNTVPAVSRTVVIDPGHGGEDGGAGDNGVLEKDVNLSIALKLRDMLRACGINTVMTRDRDISIYDSSASTTREKKNSDLQNRVKMINSSKNNILISIHQNKFTESKYSGAQIFYSSNDPESAQLAEKVRGSIVGLLQPDNKRELKKGADGAYILKKAEIPAIIAECGFLSNPEEAKLLSDDSYRQKMAFAIFCGVLEHLNNTV